MAELTTENGGILMPEPETGTFYLYMDDMEMAALSFESGVYDIEFVAPNGDVTRLMKGNVSLDREVTRNA